MIRAPAAVALALGTVLAGCQTEGRNDFRALTPPPYTIRPAPVASSPLDGQWASTDGIFVASFSSGRFVSRFTKTSEILAEGNYSISGNNVRMDWFSVQAQQQRSANCRFAGSSTVSCDQAGGGKFTLVRA